MSENKVSKKPPVSYFRLSILGMVVLVLLFIGLWALGLYQSGLVNTLNQGTATALAESDLTCKNMIELAMQQSDKACQSMGTNQLCYGNNALKVDFLTGNNPTEFSELGDIINVDGVEKLSASPLNLNNNEWGIAVFKILANLPRSLPGETVTMIAFGNTHINKDQPGIETFYFYNELGQIICDDVPFDGLMISMPAGTGIQLNINGSELVLAGTASLTATRNGSMDITLYSGAAQVTADGQTVSFGAGQQVSIPMGGQDGTNPAGPPSDPLPLSADELALACSLTGQFCSGNEIEPLSQSEILNILSGNPTESSQNTAYPTSPPLPTFATLVNTPVFNFSSLFATATKKPVNNPPAHSKTPTLTRTSTATLTPTFTPTFTTTSTATATPTATHTATATNTSTATPTFTATLGGPTATYTTTPSPTATATLASCTNITLGSLGLSGLDNLAINITNSTGATIRMDGLTVNWIESPISQKLKNVAVDGNQAWNGADNNTPSIFPSEIAWTGLASTREVSDASTEQLLLNFQDDLAVSGYSIQITFDNGCVLNASN